MQEFPFALVSINISRWALDSLESRRLSPACRKAKSAAKATDLFHTGAMYTFAKGWRANPGSIFDVGVQLSALEKAFKKRPEAAVAAANQVLPQVPA